MIHTLHNCLIFSEDKNLIAELVMKWHKIEYADTVYRLMEKAKSGHPDSVIIDSTSGMNFYTDFIKMAHVQCQIFIRANGIHLSEEEGKYIHTVPSQTSNDEFIHLIESTYAPKWDTVFHNQTILLIEDNTDIREMYALSFRAKWFIVHEADDGLTGITKAAEIKPGIILLDIMMPYMDGFEVLTTLRNNTTKIQPIIIVNSNLEWVSEEKRVKALGADYFLRKSQYTPAEVIEFIEKKILFWK